ncbi:hypothetical protein TMatcc_003556 [Talaromyces marneffei ATCC 18224]
MEKSSQLDFRRERMYWSSFVAQLVHSDDFEDGLGKHAAAIESRRSAYSSSILLSNQLLAHVSCEDQYALDLNLATVIGLPRDSHLSKNVP